MTDKSLIVPMAVLALWTGVILMMVGLRRVGGAKRGLVRASDFRLGESDRVPDFIKLPNRNYMNLLEMPTLFYAACLSIYVSGSMRPGFLMLAWLYVGLRIAHSVIHLAVNHVPSRLASFALSNFTLAAMWIWLLAVL